MASPLARLPEGTALVGGAVRDGLLDRLQEQPDLDLVVPSDAIALTKALAQELHGTCVVLDAERSIARLVLGGWTVDIARQDGDRIEDDLWRRDYRLNAIAVSLQPWGELWDPTGGLSDLQQGCLTAVSEANLIDDPLRLLRGLRLMAEIPLTISSQTMAGLSATPHGFRKRHRSESWRSCSAWCGANMLTPRWQPSQACRCCIPGRPGGNLPRPATSMA